MSTTRRARGVPALVAIALSVLLAACAAPSPQGTPDPVAGPAPVEQPAPAPSLAAPSPGKPRPGAAPVAVDRSCSTDADCMVKDVGSCCGYFPACVNTASPTDPAAVKAQCAADGMASVCGFQAISACTCTAGRCEAAGAGAPVAQ